VLFGLGGIFTEVLRDVVLRVAPVDREDALTMIGEIKGAALLQGVRGQAPGDLEALAQLIADCSQLPFRHPEIQEMDLNPVLVLSKGVLVGDVRIIV
jgi:acyl-CoA synthetase (NDP forming)